MDLVYWKSTSRTGVVFTGLVVCLASLFQLSAITVLSHICLGVMCVTFPLRLYYKLLELLRWNPGRHPFQWVHSRCFDSTGRKREVHLWKVHFGLIVSYTFTRRRVRNGVGISQMSAGWRNWEREVCIVVGVITANFDYPSYPSIFYVEWSEFWVLIDWHCILSSFCKFLCSWVRLHKRRLAFCDVSFPMLVHKTLFKFIPELCSMPQCRASCPKSGGLGQYDWKCVEGVYGSGLSDFSTPQGAEFILLGWLLIYEVFVHVHTFIQIQIVMYINVFAGHFWTTTVHWQTRR